MKAEKVAVVPQGNYQQENYYPGQSTDTRLNIIFNSAIRVCDYVYFMRPCTF